MIFVLLALAASCPVDDGPVVSVLSLPGDSSRLAVRDANGDSRLDLIQVDSEGFGYRFMLEDGSYPIDFDAYLAWPASNLAWDISDLDGDGAHEVITLTAEGEVRSWKPGPSGEFGDGRLHISARSYLPNGINRMYFVRDVDGNGLADLALPAAGRFHIHLQEPGGGWKPSFELEYAADITYLMGDPDGLEGEFGQTLRIPWFEMDDIDGNGTIDLVSVSDERADFHLALPELSSTPSWSLDLMPASQGGARNRREFDLDDLLSNFDLGVRWQIQEIDGKAPRDLLVQEGRTIKVYHGGSVTGVSPSADQVLKVSGNLVQFLVHDVTGSKLPDLQLFRAEKIGVDRAIRWLVLPGNLEFELFTYENTDGMFSRKPTRRNTVALKIPRLLTLLEDLDGIETEFQRQSEIPARTLDLDGDGKSDDVLDITDQKIRFYRGCAPELDESLSILRAGSGGASMEEFLLEDFEQMPDGESKTIDLGGYADWSFYPWESIRESTRGIEPFSESPISPPGATYNIQVVDLTGNGRQDVVIWTRPAGGDRLIYLLTNILAE
jgi:hypothetical protein